MGRIPNLDIVTPVMEIPASSRAGMGSEVGKDSLPSSEQ
jgi:hypothetical protein